VKKKIVVTGATGYVGSHLEAHLLRAGYELVCLSRHMEFRRLAGVVDKKIDLMKDRLLEEFDLTDFHNCDTLVHLAWDYETPELNAEMTRRACVLAKMAGAKKIIFLSTIDSDVAGDGFCRSKYDAEKWVLNCDVETRIVVRTGPIFGGDNEGHFLRLLKMITGSSRFFYPVPNIDARVRPVALLRVLSTLENLISYAGAPYASVVEVAGHRFYRIKDLLREICQNVSDYKKIPVHSLGADWGYFPLNRVLKTEKSGLTRLTSYLPKVYMPVPALAVNNPLNVFLDREQDLSYYLTAQSSSGPAS
jgi:nucleoside-diphosphate-sugar epimerase